MKKIDPKELQVNSIKAIGQEWMLVTAGDMDDFNTMTASWGGLGELWNRHVAFIFVRPQRYTFEFTERETLFTLSFFDPKYRPALMLCGTRSGRDTDKIAETTLTPYATENGSVSFREASMVLECRKLYAEPLKKGSFTESAIPAEIYPGDDFHMMYVAEIINAQII